MSKQADPRKVALVTGGGTGIGRAVSLALAARSIDVAVNYSRSEKEASSTVTDIEALDVKGLAVRANVANDDEVRAMLQEVISRFGRLDYLVNCAGKTVYVDMADLEGMKPEYWDQIMDVNVKGLFSVCRAAAPHLKTTRGSIVNITSVSGNTGMGSSIAYAASKAAAICVTKSLARVLAPDVRVNSVAPGIVLTRWVDGREEHVKKLGEHTPLGRCCNAEDVADVVVPLLISASMMTGQTIVVDGGAFI
jgi:3-oxoacyl-[acyl-carrier protein] reductase